MKRNLKRTYHLIFWSLLVGYALWFAWEEPAYSTPQQQDDDRVISVLAEADAYVRQGNSATNYGTETTLLAQEIGPTLGYSTLSYIRFQVPDITYEQAVLSIYNQGIGSRYFALYEAQPTTWSETLITYQNRPALMQLITAGEVTDYGWIRIDVTNFVNQNEPITLVLTHNYNFPLVFSSREVSGQEPVLTFITGAPQQCDGICPP